MRVCHAFEGPGKLAFGALMGFANDQAMGGENLALSTALGASGALPAPAWWGLR